MKEASDEMSCEDLSEGEKEKTEPELITIVEGNETPGEHSTTVPVPPERRLYMVLIR